MMFYVGDYIASTTHLSTVEHGAYLLILFHYWRTQTAPADDDSRLARIARLSLSEWDSVSVTVRSFFHAVEVDGARVLLNSKLERTMWDAYCAMVRNKAASKAGNAAKAFKRKAESIASAGENGGKNAKNSPSVSDTDTDTVSVTGSVSVSVPQRQRQRDLEIEVLRTSCSEPSAEGSKLVAAQLPGTEEPEFEIPAFLRREQPTALVVAAVPKFGMMTNLYATKGEAVAIYDTKIAEWQTSYPGVDVMAALRAINQWLIDNPKKRKTKTGMMKFINSWLSREQDRAGRGSSNGQQSFREAQNSRFIRGLGRNADRDRLRDGE